MTSQSHLKEYFKSNNRRFFLINAVQSLFSELTCSQDIKKVRKNLRLNSQIFFLTFLVQYLQHLSIFCVSQRVMDEVYKLIAHIYLKHLIKNSQRKLRRVWSDDIGETVAHDAELLHDTFSNLVRTTNCFLMSC